MPGEGALAHRTIAAVMRPIDLRRMGTGTARRIAFLVMVASAAARSGTATPEASTSKIDPKATGILKEMTGFLGRQQNLSVQTEGVMVVVTQDGQKLDVPYSSRVAVRRPDRLRAERTREAKERAFFYDGKTFTIFGKDGNLFAQAPAPPTLDQALDAARDKLGIEAPGADFLYSDAYAGLMDCVTSGTYVGQEMVNGTPVHHLAFRSKDVDWQVWIETGARPVPRRYVITTKDVPGTPDFRVELSNWDFQTKLPDDRFAFKPPPGAQKIDFLKRPQATGTGGAGEAGKGGGQ
ncbi:MAG TPA: DUF2092 domain-containing protein [Myxococcaceae bacterium]|jgi:hypothetical protein